jgi:hypothetical protein
MMKVRAKTAQNIKKSFASELIPSLNAVLERLAIQMPIQLKTPA